MATIDLDRFVATAILAVEAAGREIRPLFRSKSLITDIKQDLSPVTVADRRAEMAMRGVIALRHPDHAVLGEEGGHEGERDGRPTWVIDPIDGTRAFVTGRLTFGTLVCLQIEGVSVIGVIDQPITGERWIGVRGAPTRFEGGFGGTVGTRLRATLQEAELSATAPEMFDLDAREAFTGLARRAGRVSWGGDCYAYGLLALGQVDIVAEAGMQPWDWSALVPVVEGAGGIVTDWDGVRLGPQGPTTVLAVGDRSLHPACVDALRRSQGSEAMDDCL